MKQDIDMEVLQQIKAAELPGGSGVWFDEGGSAFTRLVFFRQRWGQIALYVMNAVTLALGDEITHEEVIDVDKNPELFDLYDWDELALVDGEVQYFLDDYHIAGSVPKFADNTPTPATTKQV